MALNKDDQQVLEDIVALDGNCLDRKRCDKCPFRSMCLPEFLHPTPPTKPQRKQMALQVLAHNVLVDEEMTKEDIKENYTWPRKEK